MSRERIYRDYLRDMIESAEKAIAFVSGMQYVEFAHDDKTVFAVTRAMVII
jgi:uncharacterized protein with HEPN domain